MKRKVASTPRPIDATDVLFLARRILWRMQRDGLAIDPAAAAAVTTGRWGQTGQRFADRILDRLDPGAGQGDLDAAIRQALQGDKTPDGKANK